MLRKRLTEDATKMCMVKVSTAVKSIVEEDLMKAEEDEINGGSGRGQVFTQKNRAYHQR